jgi:hypothetical protein
MCLWNVQNTVGRGVRMDEGGQPGTQAAANQVNQQQQLPVQQPPVQPVQQHAPVQQPQQAGVGRLQEVSNAGSGITYNFSGTTNFTHCFNVSIEDTLDHFLIDACLRLQLIDRNDLLLQYSQLP